MDALTKVRETLKSLNASGEVREFAQSVPTAVAAAAELGCEVGAIANSLIFSAESAPLLIIASGAHRVDLKMVAKELGIKKIGRAGADFVLEATGQEVGGVAPVGHPAQIKTIIDKALFDYPVIWAGGGSHHAMFSTNAEELVRMTQGLVMVVSST
ncbi:MAG: YbaK/EbsC family protein [Cyanobacteria bacterium SZAS-4]|nr:YbaK/EbsC family protein [Cyanobacteria bacterium SZAS-4]